MRLQTSQSAGNHSLGLRLSMRLAAQNFVGLAAVSLLVFLAIRAHLIAREDRALDEMQSLVVHLVEEAAATPRAEGIEHALRDQFAGREEAHLELFDNTGHVLLAGEPGKSEAVGSMVSLSADRVRLREFLLPSLRGIEGDTRPHRALISLSTVRNEALLVRLAYTLAAGAVLGTLGVSAATYWRVRRELGSVGRLVAQIDALDAKRLGLRKRLDGEGQPSELQPLIGQFNELLDRLDASYRQLAAFNADVAHELNTPLATLISSNEIAARSGADSVASRDELIGCNLEELQRLSGIVRDMLFLSTAGRGARARRQPAPSLAAEMYHVIEYHEAALELADISASVVGEASVDVDVALVRRAVSNLISNATRYACSGTCIEVIIAYVADTAPSEEGTDRTLTEPRVSSPDSGANTIVRIAVSNRGASMAPEHLGRLFDRFSRIDDHKENFLGAAPVMHDANGSSSDATASTRSRHGLGLSIVAAIARMHGGRPFASSADGRTTIGFTLLSRAS